MNPVDALAQALSLDREAAKPLVMGLGMVAAAAIAATFNVDLYSALVFGLLIVAAGAVLYIVSAVIGDPLLKKVLSWFLVLFLMLMMVMTFIVAVFRPAGWPPAYCIIQFFRKCEAVAEGVAERNYTPPTPAPVIVPAPSTPVQPAQYRVFIQFAGIIRREDIQALNQRLRTQGWNVQGSSGERTSNASGYNEVRYSTPEDEQAARALVRAVQEANITAASISAKRLSIIVPKTLEVWISR